MVRKTIMAACLLLPSLGWAEVNPKNGNYMVTYEDLVQSRSGHALNLRRTYNSRAPSLGWYGWGWGSPYETRVVAMPDGSAVVLENGTGLKHYYDPSAEQADLSRGIRALVRAATVRRSLDEAQAKTLAQSLKDDEDLRLATALELGVAGTTAVGTLWRSRRCGVLERVETGYLRRTCEGGIDHFNERGDLTRIDEVHGSKVHLLYIGNRLARASDAVGQELRYEWTPRGRIASVRSSAGGHVRYFYAGDELRRMEGGRGDHMDFEYDAAQRLTRITYVDTTSHQMTYDAQGLVSASIGREGERVQYAYGENGPNRYWTRVTSTGRDGQSRERTLGYEVAATSDGSHAVERTTEQEGNREIMRDGQGRLLQVAVRGRVVEERGYDKATGKIAFLRNIDTGETRYTYTPLGELATAEHDRGARMVARYAGGNVAEVDLVTEPGAAVSTLKYSYNDRNRLSRIDAPGVGVVNIAYDDKGEISAVDSTDGPQIAAKILGVMQSVRGLVAPAEVLMVLQ